MYISKDLLLWQDLPEHAEIVRAYFNSDRTRRVLVYRRKDGTYSYADQTLAHNNWCVTDSEQSFGTEDSVLARIDSSTKGLFGFVPVLRDFPPQNRGRHKYSLFLLSGLSAALMICGIVLFVLCLINSLPKTCWFFGAFTFFIGAGFLFFLLVAVKLNASSRISSILPYLPREAIVFLYRKVDLPDSGRVFFDKEGTHRIVIYRRNDGCYSFTMETLYIESDMEELDFSSSYAFWRSDKDTASFYDSEESVLRDLSRLLEDMTEYCEQEN